MPLAPFCSTRGSDALWLRNSHGSAGGLRSLYPHARPDCLRLALVLSLPRLHHTANAPYPRRTGATMPLARLLTLAAAATARRVPARGGFVAAAPRVRTTPLRRPRTTKAVALAAIPTIALYESSAQLINDAGCTAGAAAGAVAWIKIWTQLAERGVIDAKLARKIVHCGSGPLYLLVWRFYSDAALAVLQPWCQHKYRKTEKASRRQRALAGDFWSGDPSEKGRALRLYVGTVTGLSSSGTICHRRRRADGRGRHPRTLWGAVCLTSGRDPKEPVSGLCPRATATNGFAAVARLPGAPRPSRDIGHLHLGRGHTHGRRRPRPCPRGALLAYS